MNGTKPWYTSLTVAGAAVVTLSLVILPLFGRQDVAEKVQAEQEGILAILTKIGEVIGLILVVIGRLRATKELSITTPPAILLLCFLPVLAIGCSKVQMSPEYRYQVESAAVIVDELDKRCSEGDEAACKAGLTKASETLNLIVDALYGRGGDVE